MRRRDSKRFGAECQVRLLAEELARLAWRAAAAVRSASGLAPAALPSVAASANCDPAAARSFAAPGPGARFGLGGRSEGGGHGSRG
eukprot:8496634-Alexandrium_andersonii.AAC.1